MITASGGRPKGALRKSSGGSSKSSNRYNNEANMHAGNSMYLVVVCFIVQEGREGTGSGEVP